MILTTKYNWKLLDADIYSYYPTPWFRFSWCKRFKYKYNSWKNIYGFHLRIGRVGLAVTIFSKGFFALRLNKNGKLPWYWRIRTNNYTPIHWVWYWADNYDLHLENGGW